MHRDQPTCELRITTNMHQCLDYEATKTDRKFRDHRHYSVIIDAYKKPKTTAHMKSLQKLPLISKLGGNGGRLGTTAYSNNNYIIYFTTPTDKMADKLLTTIVYSLELA